MESVKIFISYVRNSSQDYKSLQLLKTHLASLENYGDIEVWYGGVEKALEDEEHQILTHLYEADMFLILVSPDYFNSEYCNQYELSCIHERHEDGSAILIPIIANPCRWKSNKLLADLQPLPRNGRPINTSSNVAMRDAILTSIVEDLAKVVHQLLDGETHLNLPELVPRGRLRFEHDSVRELLAKDMLPLRISQRPNH